LPERSPKQRASGSSPDNTAARTETRTATDAGVPLQVLADGPVLQAYFTGPQPLRSPRDLLRADRARALRFGHELIRRGVNCTPGGKLYLSLAHSDADIDHMLEVAAGALAAVR